MFALLPVEFGSITTFFELNTKTKILYFKQTEFLRTPRSDTCTWSDDQVPTDVALQVLP